jgi:iron complex outermembrane receptor protein
MKTGLNSTRAAAMPRYAIPVAAAVAAILAAHSGAARAADDAQGPQAASPAVQVEEVIVTGYRKSLNAALDLKRDSVGSVDQIVAEDIAAFPELNLAESIQRIPGVSIQRDAGEGRQISVRGLGPQYTRVRMNGMEALTTVSTSDANGGTNRDRSFDFNVFASELFNNITVHKTSSADIDEGSLGATVDLRTARPFDYNGFTAVMGAKENYNDLAATLMPRYSGLISDIFFDGKFGALVSVAYQKRAIVDDGAATVRWMNGQQIQTDPTKVNPANPNDPLTCLGCVVPSPANSFTKLGAGYTGPSLAQLNAAFRPRLLRYEEYHTDESRLGITNSLQFKPTDKTLINLDTLFAQLDGTREEEQIENPSFSSTGATNGGINGVVVRSATIDANNNLVAGTFDNVDIRSEHRYDINDTKFRQHVLSLEQGITDTLKFNGQVGWAQSILTSPVSTTLIWDIYGVNGYSYDTGTNALNNRLPLQTYGDAKVTDPNAWKLTQVRLRPGDVFNTFTNYQGDLEWAATEAVKLKVGGELKKYFFKTDSLRRSSETAPAAAAAIPGGNYGTLASLTGLGDLPANSVRTWAVPDIGQATSVLGLNDPALFPVGITAALGSNFNVSEKDTSAFSQADWTTEMFAIPIRGSLGVRWVHTDQISTGYSTVAGALQYGPTEHTYNDVLPSLNVVAEVTSDFQIRASAAKVMSRAGLASLNPGSNVSISGQNKTVTTGNPNIDPIRGKAYDLGFEWYFAKESLLSTAFFYKKIDSFVETSRTVTNFAASGLPNDQAIAACLSAGRATDATCLDGWTVSVPTNTPGGNLKGAEVSYQQPFSFLPMPFNNFGTILNYTYVTSNIKYVNTNAVPQAGVPLQYITNTLLNLSKNAANLTLYYDNGTWSARVSGAYRSPYLTNVPGANLNDVEGTKQTINVDFASSWSVTENFQLTLEALNLTNQFQYQYVDSNGNRMNYYHQQGRDYLVGARYKF